MSVYFIGNLSRQAKIALKFIKATNLSTYATVALIEIHKDRLVFTATTGHVLFNSEVRYTNDNVSVDGKMSIVVDIPTLKYLSKKGNSLRFDDGELDGTNFKALPSKIVFPSYAKVLETFLSMPIAVEPMLLNTELLEAAQLMGNAKTTINTDGIVFESLLGTLVIVGRRGDK